MKSKMCPLNIKPYHSISIDSLSNFDDADDL